jgi:DNA polymerase-3 subunit gamma/tau
MLLKGLEEVGRAPRPMTAAEMLLIRMCYAANLPPLDEVIRGLTGSGAAQARPAQGGNESRHSRNVADSFDAGEPPRARRVAGEADAMAPRAQYEPVAAPVIPALPRPDSFQAVVALAAAKREVKLKISLEEHVELVRFKAGHIELHLLPGAPRDLANDLGKRLQHWTQERWIISLTDERGERPLGEVRREHEAKMVEEARRHPTVQSVLRHFPGAEITSVREIDTGNPPGKKD